jgi:uncharacterized protein YbcI
MPDQPHGDPELPDERRAQGVTLAAISRRMVGLLKEYYGKGPTRARTYQTGEVVVVLLSGGYTQVERTLIETGRRQVVIDQRNAFQEVMRPRFKQVVEEEMRREVIAFMSATHQDPDYNAELFVLAPLDAAENGQREQDADRVATADGAGSEEG